MLGFVVPYHVKPGYVERLEPEYWLDETADTVWQPDVYREAASLAERIGATRIVDVGCGSAEKLAPLHDRFDLVGIDFGPNIETCRARYRFGEWLEADFEAEGELPLEHCAESLLVCADVIEHLVAPEPLLRKLRGLLDHGALALILTTPERDLRRGRAHTGPPPHAAHVREWNLEELKAFLADEGLTGLFGLTRTNDREFYLHTIFAVVPGPRLARKDGLERWWSYREGWQELVHRAEAETRGLLASPWLRVGLKVGRTLRRHAPTSRWK
jgi:SAM-dependent methyltransferase